MSERNWKWFKNGWQWDVQCLARKTNNELCSVGIVVWTENKDDNEARRMAIDEVSRYGYRNVEVRKLIKRF